MKISKLFELIDNQLNRLQQMFPQEQVVCNKILPGEIY
jgi:hypothetical protein